MNRLQRLAATVDRLRRRRTRKELAQALHSRSADRRLLGLLLIRHHIESGDRRPAYLTLARSRIPDSDNDCRWQALIVVGEYVNTHPEVVWEVIREFGGHPDRDMRDAVATVLLEHLLEARPTIYFPRIRAELRIRDWRFADMASSVWVSGNPSITRRARRLQVHAGRLARRRRREQRPQRKQSSTMHGAA